MSESNHRTCKCGAVYDRSEHIVEEREISSFECAVCGATIENWNSAWVPRYRFIARPLGRPMTPNPSWISRRGRSRTAIPRQKSRARTRLRRSWAPALTFHRPGDAGRCRPAARLIKKSSGANRRAGADLSFHISANKLAFGPWRRIIKQSPLRLPGITGDRECCAPAPPSSRPENRWRGARDIGRDTDQPSGFWRGLAL
jgi:hypothetical protein